MKVRLVRPLVAEIAQLDTVATAAVDPPGTTSSGYDPDFKEPVVASPSPEGLGESQRQEKAAIRVPAQVEFGPFEQLRQAFSGNLPDSRVVLVMDFEDLERLGLIDAGGNETLLRPNDRVVQILNGKGEVIEAFPNPPGLFITELRPGYGLDADRNIILAFANEREQGLARGI